MHGEYDPFLVGVSIAIAIFASFTALNLTGRLAVSERQARGWWLFAASAALGGGIWSMHFIGMLAFSTPMPISYDIRLTTISLLLPVIAVAIGLQITCHFGAASGARFSRAASSSGSRSWECTTPG